MVTSLNGYSDPIHYEEFDEEFESEENTLESGELEEISEDEAEAGNGPSQGSSEGENQDSSGNCHIHELNFYAKSAKNWLSRLANSAINSTLRPQSADLSSDHLLKV